MQQRKISAGAAESRIKIVEAATQLFTRTPFDDVAVEEIARRAGVAHGLVFHYFGTKSQLYEQVSQAAADRLDAIHVEATRDVKTPDGKLRAFLESHMDALARHKKNNIFYSRRASTPAIQAIWENSRLNAIHLLLGFYGVQDPTEPLVVATRAWLACYDELVFAWIKGRAIMREGVILVSLELFRTVMEHAEKLGASDTPHTVAKAPARR